MIDLDNLKKNWQNQKFVMNEKDSFDKTADKSLTKLKKFEKKQFRINIFKTLGVSFLTVYLIISMFIFSSFSLIKLISIVWLTGSIIYFLVIYWKMQLKVNKLNVNGNSLDFIDDVLENFQFQKKFFKEKFWIFGGALIIGINILYLDLLKDLPITERIGLHLIFCLLMILIIWAGIKFRMFRFKKEYEPIIIELTEIKKDLEDIK